MITPDSTILDIKRNEILSSIFPYFIFNKSGSSSGNILDDSVTLIDIERKNRTWSADDMAFGLNTLIDQNSHKIAYKVYSESEISVSPDKDDVLLFYFKADEDTKKNRTLILAAGGAYGAVCSLVEAFPSAASFSKMGIDTFCLNYRVRAPAPLFPKPMEDMAAAVRYLTEHSQELGINMDNYAAGGFSAGGHLASCFGLKTTGYLRYQVPRPTLLILNYPLIDIWGNISPLHEPIRSVMLGGYLGENYSKEKADEYNASLLVDSSYPSCFIAHAKDDTTVPIALTDTFVKNLEVHEIPVEFFKAESGGHGYGLGSWCEARGWTEHAVAFWGRIVNERK